MSGAAAPRLSIVRGGVYAAGGAFFTAGSLRPAASAKRTEPASAARRAKTQAKPAAERSDRRGALSEKGFLADLRLETHRVSKFSAMRKTDAAQIKDIEKVFDIRLTFFAVIGKK